MKQLIMSPYNIFRLSVDRLMHRSSRVQPPAVCCASGYSRCVFVLKRTVFSCSVEGEKKTSGKQHYVIQHWLSCLFLSLALFFVFFVFYFFIALNRRCLKPLLGTKWFWVCWLLLSEWQRTEAHWLVGKPVGRTGRFCYGHSSWLKCRYSVRATLK